MSYFNFYYQYTLQNLHLFQVLNSQKINHFAKFLSNTNLTNKNPPHKQMNSKNQDTSTNDAVLNAQQEVPE